ncbi:MAG: hypothetical protein HYU36_00805 [Planctomycetes bacterium]|nr:hypothetical protein [Planctomycetota bacterium]
MFGTFLFSLPSATSVCARHAAILAALALMLCHDARAEFCLTGNAEEKERNRRLEEGGYRYVWAGTDQPAFPAERYLSGWLSFTEGLLCDGQNMDLPFGGQLREKCYYTNYDWPENGYELEVDLGQVCKVTRFKLNGAQSLVLKGYNAVSRRWLPLAAGVNEVSLTDFQTRRFRVEVAGRFAEMTLWGDPIEKGAPEKMPRPMQPVWPSKPFTGLNLKPSVIPMMAGDPFIYPQPQEMSFSDQRLSLPKVCPLVIGREASEGVRQIARGLAEQVASLLTLDFRVGEEAGDPAGPSVWIGLAGDAGACGEVGNRLGVGPDSMPSEGYGIEITPSRAVLVGRDEPGLYYATRTLLLLLQPLQEGARLPAGRVRDFPRAGIRPAFAYMGWGNAFKHRLALALATLKYNHLMGHETPREWMRQNYVHAILHGALFPQSVSGTDGEFLEAYPGVRAKALDPSRLSGCCSHPNFWMGMAAGWARLTEGWPGEMVDVGYDEILHNPYNVCARCRARGLSSREMLLDAYLKGYRYLRKRGFNVLVYSTGFRKFDPFDMFVDVPADSILSNYASRTAINKELRDLGFKVIGGDTEATRIGPDSPLHSAIVWNWGAEDRASMMNEGTLQSQVVVAEENWSLAGKAEWKSPPWHARLNRAIDFVKRLIDFTPLPVAGEKPSYFSIDLSDAANRSLRDEVWGDGEGWLDEGPARDLRHLPAGRQVLDQIPYDLAGGARAAVVVAGPGSADRFLPDQVAGIPVRRKAGELFFLHACAQPVWTSLGRRVLLLGFYRIRYEDGSFVTADVNYGQHVVEWLRPYGYLEMEVEPAAQPLPDARVAWRGGTDSGEDATLYAMAWRNPYPDKTIADIDVLASAQRESNRNRLCLLAVSGREPTERDLRVTARWPDRPPLRVYRPRPGLPEGVEALDLVRKTPPPFPVPMAYQYEWETADRWFQARIEKQSPGTGGHPTVFEKSELNCGVYSVLDGDDDPWRCAREGQMNPCTLHVRFKRLIPLRGVGVKGIMQRIRYPGLFPTDFEVRVMDEEGEMKRVGEVTGHVGQEGEERWVFEKPIPAAGLEVRVNRGEGLSAILLYARRGALPAPSFKPPKMDKEQTAIGEEAEKKEGVTEEEVVDEFEGF